MLNRPLRICLAGATGHVGRRLAAAIAAASDLHLVSGTSRRHAGSNLADVFPDLGVSLPLCSQVDEALQAPADVLIDYTHPTIVEQNVYAALERGVHVVVGTSGLTDAQYEAIDVRARKGGLGVIAAGNFSLTAALLQHFALIAARHLSAWEIVESAGAAKADAPNGTTRELAFRLAQIRSPEQEVAVVDTLGLREARGATLNGSQIHSLRLPGVASRTEIIFGAPEQRLTMSHEAIGSGPYVEGTLLAARKAPSLVGLRRGLDSVLEFQPPGA